MGNSSSTYTPPAPTAPIATAATMRVSTSAPPAKPLNPALARLRTSAPKVLTPRTKEALTEALSEAIAAGAALDAVVDSIKSSGTMSTKRVAIVGGDEAEVDAFYSAFANLGDLENACSTPVKRAIAVTPLVVPSSEGNDVRVEVANLAKSSVNASAIAGADAVLIVCSKAAKSSKIVGCVIVIVILASESPAPMNLSAIHRAHPPHPAFFLLPPQRVARSPRHGVPCGADHDGRPDGVAD